jgi:hypothetical protein
MEPELDLCGWCSPHWRPTVMGSIQWSSGNLEVWQSSLQQGMLFVYNTQGSCTPARDWSGWFFLIACLPVLTLPPVSSNH